LTYEVATDNLQAMLYTNLRPLIQAMTFSGLCLGCSMAQAQNQNYGQSSTQDEMAAFMAERGIVAKLGEQVSQAGYAVGNTASDLVVNAMGFLGVPYKRGGNSAESGFDCSGFVKAMYQQTVGLVLPRRAADQAAATQSIAKSELQPGDLVFFNTLRSAFSHVGIYVGDNKFIHSPRSGSVVRVEDMRIGYWSSRFDGARRVSNVPGTQNIAQNTVRDTSQNTTQNTTQGIPAKAMPVKAAPEARPSPSVVIP
jgi:cell wall-associated NlpC family hydrolase